MNATTTNPWRAALIGFLLILPIGLLWSAVFLHITAIEFVLKALLTADGEQPHVGGYLFILGGLLALPIAAVVSGTATFPKSEDGRRRLYLPALIVMALALALLLPTWVELATEIYRCDILRIPNCD